MIYDHGPVCLAFAVYDDFYTGSPSFDENGVYTYDGVSDYRGGHQIVAVGYVDTPGNPDYDGYWICKNSWGSTWGPWNDGCFGIAYGECDIEQELVWCDYYSTGEIFQYLTVFNDGNIDLIVSDVTIDYEIGEPTGWLDAKPTSFTVSPLSSAYLKISVDSTFLTNGEYHGYINIYSSDPDENPVIIPVILNVTVPIPSIDVTKKVWNGSSWVESINANIDDIVTFNCTIHNDGTCCNLTDINITDYLPESLEYVSGSASPREPDVIWGKNLTWLFPGPLSPCSSIYIEIDARVIDSGIDINHQNATAFCSITSTWVSDEDTATVISTGDITPPEISDVTVTMSDPVDTDPLFGWENISCTATDNVDVHSVWLNITYPDMHTENVSMTKNGDIYYHNATFSDVGSYSYFIWANDTSDNVNTSSVDTFVVPPNWDVNMDGDCDGWDLMAMQPHWQDTGSLGWIRSDVNNDGSVNGWDLMAMEPHWQESWWPGY